MKTDVSFIEIDEYKFPLAYRPNTSDLPTARVIFERGDYFLEYTGLLAFFNGNFKPRFIIDGGANVGYASVFFANRYPECEKILAIEPEIENFEILQYNVQNYPQVEAIRAALWSRETDLSVAFGEFAKTNDAFMTSEVENSAPPPPKKFPKQLEESQSEKFFVNLDFHSSIF